MTKYTASQLQETGRQIMDSDVYLDVTSAITYAMERQDGEGLEDLESLQGRFIVEDEEEMWEEPASYHAVSSRLYDDLEDAGEIVGEMFGWKVWGRVSGNQAIYIDGVFEDLATARLDRDAELKRKYGGQS